MVFGDKRRHESRSFCEGSISRCVLALLSRQVILYDSAILGRGDTQLAAWVVRFNLLTRITVSASLAWFSLYEDPRVDSEHASASFNGHHEYGGLQELAAASSGVCTRFRQLCLCMPQFLSVSAMRVSTTHGHEMIFLQLEKMIFYYQRVRMMTTACGQIFASSAQCEYCTAKSRGASVVPLSLAQISRSASASNSTSMTNRQSPGV